MWSSTPRTWTPRPRWRPAARGWPAAWTSRAARASRRDPGGGVMTLGFCWEASEVAEYMVFIWDDEQSWEGADPATVAATMAAHQEFIARHAAALRGGNRLHPSAVSTSLRRTGDGGVSISDGAFAETKEGIGGYYLIEVTDLDEGLRIAAEGPAPFGGGGVGPVFAAGQAARA